MSESAKLEADLDAWHEQSIEDGGCVPDFWSETNASEEIAKWLIGRGWVKSDRA